MHISKYEQILITGGTGSFGKKFLKRILENYPNFKRVVIYSRDELKQWELQQIYPPNKFPQLRFFIGDVRDFNRLKRAFENIDVVVHAAALKHVTAAEYNPVEFIKTNVLGAENIVNASIDCGVSKIIALSTDKAAAPTNLYGASKLCSDKLFIAANNIKGSRDISFSVVRYGNVIGSRGSIVPLFLKMVKKGFLTITDNEMTRFNITLDEGIDIVIWSINNCLGGEIIIPKIKSFRVVDMAEAIGPTCKKIITGIRPGEKIHEEMITKADSFNTFDLGKYFGITNNSLPYKDHYDKLSIPYYKVKEKFSYNSFDNKPYMNIDELRECVRLNVDESFKPI